MHLKNYIFLGIILLLVVFSNSEFIANQDAIHHKFRKWTKYAHTEKTLSANILSEYYQYRNTKINHRLGVDQLKIMNDEFIALNSCEQFRNFQSNIHQRIDYLLELNDKKGEPIASSTFTNAIEGIQNQLNLIIAHFEYEENREIEKIQLFQILFNVLTVIIVSYLFYSGILRTERKWNSLSEKKDESIHNLLSQQNQLGQNIFIQSANLKEYIENLEVLFRSTDQNSQEVQDLIEDNLYEIKNILNSMNLYYQSNVQEKNISSNLTEAIQAILGYFDLLDKTTGIPKDDIWIKCEQQDILLFLKFLFKTINENKKDNQPLSIQLSIERIDNYIEIKVTHNGNGIAPELMPHLFQLTPYLESKQDTHSALIFTHSLLKKIINDYQGDFKVESEYGKGSSYRFSIPLIE